MTSFLEQYWNLQRDADSKYRDAVVLIEKGSFMECYSIPGKIGRAERVAQVLNMIITKCNKNLPTSETNPYMVGFPKAAHDKNVQVMIASGMTIVWVEQKWDPWRKTISGRDITRIITPGTYMEHPPSDDGYHIACVHTVSLNDSACHFVAVMDTSVGALETIEMEHDDDLLWFLNAYNPRETLCITPTDYVRDHFPDAYVKSDAARYSDTVYQTHMLNKVYLDGSEHDIAPMFRPAVVCLLEFVHTCHPNALTNLTYPKECWGSHLSLHNNAVSQLDLLRSDRGSGVIGVLNKTRTAMGKRLLTRQLLRPHVVPDTIQALYDRIENLLQNERYKDIQSVLSQLPDLERLMKKIDMNMSNEQDVSSMHKALRLISTKLDYDVSFVHSHWDHVWDCDACTFVSGYDTALDALRTERENTQRDMNMFIEKLGNMAKIEQKKTAENDFYYQLVTTAKKGETLRKQFPDIAVCRLNATSVKLVSAESIDPLLVRMSQVCADEQERHRTAFQHWRDTLRQDYGDRVRSACKFVAELDCDCSKAECAVVYKQVKPVLWSDVHGRVTAESLKHPLLENYVGNDCVLDPEHNGMLLYGINGAGKSCYSKSIAINLIMAQAGFYVHATSFRYTPFTKIFTRIQCDDNVYKGVSSFTVEMQELRTILRLADERSLVIGDELCKGTEDLSAVSLVAASIQWMSEHHVKYVFATHLHKLPSIDFVKSIPNLCIKHMASEYNTQLGKLVFLRKLEPGQGDPLYGIEIARQILGVPQVANMAMMARQQLETNTNESQQKNKVKKSRYNKKVLVEECAHCRSVHGLHTHHVVPQQAFSKNESRAMNHKDNLVVLCQKCHEKIHQGVLQLQLMDTFQGKLPVFGSG